MIQKTGNVNILFFGGAESWIEEELWLDNNTLILAGIQKDELANRHPVIYLVNISTGLVREFRCTNDQCIQLRKYTSPRLYKIRIAGI